MIRTLPKSRAYDRLFKFYVILYFTFLFAPLLVTCVLAFNDSQFPALPWKGFTVQWFTANLPERVGIFHDQINLDSIWVSFRVAFFVTILSLAVGTCAAFLFEQEEFRFKPLLYFLMLAPLVIPGVILGISILLLSNTLGLYFAEQQGTGFLIFLQFLADFFDYFSDLFDIGIITNPHIDLGDDVIPAEILDRSHIAEGYRVHHAAGMPQPQ